MTDTVPGRQVIDSRRRFTRAVSILMAFVATWGSIVAVLQVRASVREDLAAERAQAEAVAAMGELIRADERALHGLDLLAAEKRAEQRAAQAYSAANAARLEGDEFRAQSLEASAAPWEAAQETLANLSPLLSPDYADDYARYYEDLHRQAYLEYELQQAALREADAYGDKADAYVSVISMLAAVLLLLGLSLTVFNWLRYIFVGVGLGMAGASALWVLLVFLQPIHATPREAMEHFADGLVAQNIAFSSRQVEAEVYDERALASFNAALDLDDSYANAYEKRGITLLEQRLRDSDPERNARAAADLERAIRLGNANSIVYANLGWAYYLAQDYTASIEASRRAVRLDPSECVAHFNIELASLALDQADGWGLTSGDAMNCLLEAPPSERNWLFEVTVVDLHDLQAARPASPQVRTALNEFKQAWASMTLLGQIAPAPISASMSSLTFAGEIGSDGVYLDVGESFPAGTPNVYTILSFEAMQPDHPWLVRLYLDGESYNTFQDTGWDHGEGGETWVRFADLPLPAGEYLAEVYVAGNLMISEIFQVETGEFVSVLPYASSAFRLQLNYPEGWVPYEDAAEEGQLFISPPDDYRLYFQYWSRPAGGDSQTELEGLMNFWLTAYSAVSFGEEGDFYMGRMPGARWVETSYIDPDGIDQAAHLMSMVDPFGDAHFIVIQAPVSEFGAIKRLYFDPMLRSLVINR